MLAVDAAQIRNEACPAEDLRVALLARRARRCASLLLALLTTVLVASAQVAAVRADLTVDAKAAEGVGSADDDPTPLSWATPEAAAYRRDVAPAPVLDASESERSEEVARHDDAMVGVAQVRSALPPRIRGAASVASATWVGRLVTSTALPRGPPSAHR